MGVCVPWKPARARHGRALFQGEQTLRQPKSCRKRGLQRRLSTRANADDAQPMLKMLLAESLLGFPRRENTELIEIARENDHRAEAVGYPQLLAAARALLGGLIGQRRINEQINFD